MNKKILLFLLILISLCAISHVSANDVSDFTLSDASDISEQNILTVDYDENGQIMADNNNFRNIQEQIDQAEENSTIFLDGETYECDYLINVNKAITIDGNGSTIKLGGGYVNYTTPFFNVNASNVVFYNIKFVGSSFLFGGAIYWSGNDGNIVDCEFINNTAFSNDYGIGGALMMIGDNCVVENCIFSNNRADKHGGAILWNGAGGLIKNCVFDDNKATGINGTGGALVLNSINCLVDNCTFENNYVTDYGGAICVLNYNNKIINSKFSDNYVLNNLTSFSVDDLKGGGAIYSAFPNLVIDNCSFINNRADGALGGAISLSSNNTLTNSFFKGNNALLGNDLLYSENSTLTSNHFVLDYMETQLEAIFGISENNTLNETNTFEITKIDSVVTFSAGMVFKYGEIGSITVKVDGGEIFRDDIRVLNHPEANISYEDNILKVSGLSVGKYTLRVTTTPDENHNSVDGDLNITVNKATAVIQAAKITVALKKSTKWTVKLVDPRTKKGIANMYVTLKVYTGKKYKTAKLKTNSKGEASYQTKGLTLGTHKVVLSATHAQYTFNSIKQSIVVVKQTPLIFNVKRDTGNDGATLQITVLNKATKKPVNGVKVKLLVYTGKTYKTIVLKSKNKGKFKGVCGYGTNKLSVGNHKVVLMPVDVKYGAYAKSTMTIRSSAKKVLPWEHKT